MPHLPLEECPPLADYDWAPHLIQKGFPVGPIPHEHQNLVLIPRILVFGSAFRDREEARILGPHESVSQGIHCARLPHGF